LSKTIARLKLKKLLSPLSKKIARLKFTKLLSPLSKTIARLKLTKLLSLLSKTIARLKLTSCKNDPSSVKIHKTAVVQGIGFVMNIVTVDSAICIDISIVSFLNK
jgi:hypothetical protein